MKAMMANENTLARIVAGRTVMFLLEPPRKRRTETEFHSSSGVHTMATSARSAFFFLMESLSIRWATILALTAWFFMAIGGSVNFSLSRVLT